MKTIRVLIVEDDPRISELHRRFTEKVEGFETVGIANTLPEAQEMAEVLEPDLVLLDLFFPEGSGMDLLWKLRSQGRQVDLILITAAKEVSALQEAMRGGAFDYIIKPVVFGRFEDSLRKFREHRGQLEGRDTLEQSDVDKLLHPAAAGSGDTSQAPKGIDPLTLKKVVKVFEDAFAEGAGAEEVAERIGASRSTARRYLEFLVSTGCLRADVVYGTVGRPERRYSRK
ncbi:MAG: two-component system response regulator [Desulfuromonas sp.]|uniref:response regulator n=1 Tax=Desulfuromonas sp. TaxID=892 RepID=UPI000CC55F82|nr:response regulator [Desulfuromonas sp.]PLX84557.1 MAG: two-component system response regulator [Desulfuromonas sp.]